MRSLPRIKSSWTHIFRHNKDTATFAMYPTILSMAFAAKLPYNSRHKRIFCMMQSVKEVEQ